MFAGKTEFLIRSVREATEAGLRVAVLKPNVDTRNDGARITSHRGTIIEAVTVASDFEVPSVDVLALDEVQFFPQAIVPRLVRAVSDGMTVIACGLDLDANGMPFGPVPTLLALADDVVKLRGVCAVCGQASTRSQRLISYGTTILVGGSNLYEPRCRGCFTPYDS